MLRVHKLSKSFQQASVQIKALDDLSFDLSPGRSLAVVGPSGSGKTSLLSLIAGLDSPSSGEIIFDDQKIHQLSEKDLTQYRAQKLGIVFQQFHLMPHLTALENVMLPLEIQGGADSYSKKAKEALAEVGLAERTDHLPSQLSGGECQRVAIARAFVTRPRLILADEPSGSLDQATGERVIELMMRLAKGSQISMLLVTHDDKLALRCDDRLRLEKGQQK